MKSTIEITESPELCSRCIWDYIQRNKAGRHRIDENVEIPRVLLQYWHDSDNIPADVERCIDSWDKLNMDRELFDDKRAREFIATNLEPCYLEAFNRCNHPAMRADYFRLCFILVRGGFYVDADDVYYGQSIEPLYSNNRLKIQTLCHDEVNQRMVRSWEYLPSDAYDTNCIYYINNDPIVSPPNHPVIQIALDRCTKYILDKDADLLDIHKITGPTNFTASLVQYVMTSQCSEIELDYEFILNWDDISIPNWPLEYRNDQRDWRKWNGCKL